MNHRRPSAVEALRHKTNERHSIEAHYSSLTDEEFMREIAADPDSKHIRDVILTVSLREDNIAMAKESCRMCITSKEMTNALKTQTPHQISELLCSLDDTTFMCLAKHNRVRDLILNSPSLGIRYNSLA